MRTHIFQVAKAVLGAILISLAFVLVFTVLIQLFSISTSAIRPVNQVFKIIAIVGGGLLFIRGDKGLIKGLIHGVLSVVLTFLLFGLIAGTLSCDWKFAIELLIGIVAGGITGVIAVNIKRKT
ncbi:MAG: TIGR04086 family membrane protein [Clostridiales bacterium]|nr:TIGR04086 family membrane protein [Clostridiales bacterium]